MCVSAVQEPEVRISKPKDAAPAPPSQPPSDLGWEEPPPFNILWDFDSVTAFFPSK